ncbi:MAG: hypothetical protein C0404_09460 [Verrucomicrobia bacterium]|nr:hypothetical protein [Verrucomicrobiota bacterium]
MTALMFVLGFVAIVAQVLFTREMLVAFLGNELTIGAIMAGWLLGISLGSASAVLIMRVMTSRESRRRFLVALLVVLALVLPVQIYVMRIARILTGIPPGEYASFGVVLCSAFLFFLPACWCIGAAFPVACEVLSPGAPGGKSGSAVGRLYAVESFGSMVGGVILTFVFLPLMGPYHVIVMACILLLTVPVFLLNCNRCRVVLAPLILALGIGCLVYPGWATDMEKFAVTKRWEAFGALGGNLPGSPVVRLAASRDTKYQNLAVTESDDQFNLFGNGKIYFSFPDPSSYEHNIHFFMAQKPEARRVLLVGGNPVGDIPELLKYGIERLVYVDLDPGVDRIISEVVPAAYRAAMADKRVERVLEDAPRYVKMSRDQFDVVLVNAPEPSTAAANRFYTLEFYRGMRRILSEDGFICTAVTSSERLQGDAVDLGASVYKTLREVFPVVLVTAEARNRFIAGGPESGLTFDRETLAGRSEKAAVPAKYWKPVYFLGADEIAADKTRQVAEKFMASRVPLNTDIRPVTYFYNLQVWLTFSGSGGVEWFKAVETTSHKTVCMALLLVGLLSTVIGFMVPWIQRRDMPATDEVSVPRRVADLWRRLMLGLVILAAGFTGMALEVLLIFLFQGLYGYVYARIGFIFASFMCGLVLGGPSGNRLAAGGSARSIALRLGIIELGVAMLALAIPMAAEVPGRAGWLEIVIYLSTMAVGWTVGAEFMLATRLFRETGVRQGSAVAVVNALDLAGAAIGAVAVGIFLVPVIGIPSTCVVLASLKAASMMFIWSASIQPIEPA